MQLNIWDKLGWKAKPEKPSTLKAAQNETDDKESTMSLRAQMGGVVTLHTEKQWEAAIGLTKESDTVLIVDFTATWCAD